MRNLQFLSFFRFFGFLAIFEFFAKNKLTNNFEKKQKKHVLTKENPFGKAPRERNPAQQ